MTIHPIALTLLVALAASGLALYGFVAWLEYTSDRREYGTDPRAAFRYALTWPVRVYHFWRAE